MDNIASDRTFVLPEEVRKRQPWDENAEEALWQWWDTQSILYNLQIWTLQRKLAIGGDEAVRLLGKNPKQPEVVALLDELKRDISSAPEAFLAAEKLPPDFVSAMSIVFRT